MRYINLALISIALLCGQKAMAQSLTWEKAIFSTDSLTMGQIIKHDAADNIYTAGIVYSGSVYLSKQDNSGNPVWSVVLVNPDSTGIYSNALRHLVVDSAGNSYVSMNNGGRGVIEKFNSSGVNQWIYFDSGSGMPGIVLDMVLTPDHNIAFTAVNRVGVVQKTFVKSITQSTRSLNWATQITMVDTPGTEDIVTNGYHSIGCDMWGNIYAGVLNLHLMANTQYITFAKCTPSGSLRWQAQTPTAVWTWETMGGYKTDYNGNIYATGYTSNVSPSNWALKIDSGGAFTYFNHYSYGGRSVKFIDIQNDSLGNAYLSGTIRNGFGPAFCVAAKINAAGTPAWIKTFYHDTTQQNSYQQGYVLNNNTYYTSGIFYDTSSHSQNETIVSCYDSSGNLLWHREKVYLGRVNQQTVCYAMDVDNSNNILIAGFTSDTSASSFTYLDLYVAKYNATATTAIHTPTTIQNILLYPIPAEQVVHVKMPALINTQWEVTNMYGQRTAGGYDNGELTISTALWPAGNYIFRCRDTDTGNAASVLFTVVH